MPTNWRASSLAATSVEPDPQKGSSALGHRLDRWGGRLVALDKTISQAQLGWFRGNSALPSPVSSTNSHPAAEPICSACSEQKRSLGAFFDWYNLRRPHQALGWRTPDEAIGDRAGAVRRGSAQPTVHKFIAPPRHRVRRPVPSPPSIGRGKLRDHGIEISMDGRGRCHDNIFVERLWWTVKHEWVYLRPAADGIGTAPVGSPSR